MRWSRCIVPRRDGVFSGLEFRTNLWDKYSTAAPAQRRQYGALSNTARKPTSLATRYSINPKMVAKWRKHPTVLDARMGPTPVSTVLSAEQEAIAVAFLRYTLLALDDCLYALQATIPHLSCSAPHRCFQRHQWFPGGHSFARICRAFGVEHRLTKPTYPWTNGQVERMNRTIKEAAVQRFHYQTTDELNEHLQAFLLAYNHAKRLKTLRGLTPHEFVCAQWQKNPTIFTWEPTHLTLGLYI